MENSPKSIQPSPLKEVGKNHKGEPRRGRTIHIRNLFLLLWDKRLLILASVIAVVSFTAVYTCKSPKLYKATTRLVIEKETLNLLPPSKNILAVDTSTSDYYNTQHKILKSRTLAQRVIDVLRLKATSPSGTERPMSHPELLRKVIITPLRETRLVDVSVVDREPKRAAKIANTIAQEFIKFNADSKVEARKAAARAIGRQLGEVASGVQEADRRFNDFKARYNIVSVDEKQNLIYKNLTALTDAASQARSESIDAEAAYKRIRDLPLDELKRQKSIVRDRVIEQLEADFLTAERVLKTLSGRYGNKHPKILAQKAIVERIGEEIDGRAEAIREMLRNAWVAAKQRETEALQAVEEAKKRSHEFDAIAAQYRKHRMEVETNKKTYEELLSRSMESFVEIGARGQDTSNIRTIDRALPPDAPFRPRPLVNMSLAVVVGLALGCGSAFFLVYLDDKVRNRADVTEDLGRALLGEIPIARGKHATEREKGIIAYEQPDSAVAEAYRNLRTSVQLTAPDGNFPSLLLTSVCRAEGKTTTAINLGFAVAQAGRKVLLVDTDMRRPTMHRHFDIKNSRGLIGYLSGEGNLEDALVERSELATPKKRKEETTGLEQGELWVLPCGDREVYNPTEVIGSQRMQELVADLKNRFDVLIFDSPPCRFSDPLLLAKMVEGVVVVVEAGRFSKSLIAQGLENLDRIEKGKILGVVLNKYDPKKSGSYGYSGYRSYYYERYYDRYYDAHWYGRRREGLWHRLLHKPPAGKGAGAGRKSPDSSSPTDTPSGQHG